MSYILDALKKADQERKLSRTPNLMSERGAIPRRQGKHPVIYLTIFMLVAAGGAAGWYLGHEENIPLPQAEMRAQIKPIPETQNPSVTENNDAVAIKEAIDKIPVQSSTQNKNAAQDAKTNSEKKKPVTQSDNKAAPSQKTKDTSISNGPKDSAQIAVKKKPGNRIYAINELPDEIRQGLPSLAISTHIYSTEKTERLVSINGHIGREGQEITAGLVLDSITPDGVILRYQGYRFSVGLR